MSRTHNPPDRNAQRGVWFHIQKDISKNFFAAIFFAAAWTKLRDPASTDLDNGGHKECKQGNHKYNLRGGERGPSDDPEAEQPSDQSNDEKGNRPVKHDDLLRLRRSAKTPKPPVVFR
jgi:hypothetical protein